MDSSVRKSMVPTGSCSGSGFGQKGRPISNKGLSGTGSSGSGATPIQGMQVFVDYCLICNNYSYLSPRESRLDKGKVVEVREAFYSLFEVPVPDSFVKSCFDEIPLCAGCTYKLGRLKELQDQLTAIQREFTRMKEEIAFSIVDVVAGSNEGNSWGAMDLKSLPGSTLQRYLKQSEVDTLQRLIFDGWLDILSENFRGNFLWKKGSCIFNEGFGFPIEWHDRCATDADDNIHTSDTASSIPPVKIGPSSVKSATGSPTFKKNIQGQIQSPPSLKKFVGRPPSLAGPSTSQSFLSKARSPVRNLNRIPIPITSSTSSISKPPSTGIKPVDKSGQKTTVISITTTPEGRREQLVKKPGQAIIPKPLVGIKRPPSDTSNVDAAKKARSPKIDETQKGESESNQKSTTSSPPNQAKSTSTSKLEERKHTDPDANEDDPYHEEQNDSLDTPDIEITKVDPSSESFENSENGHHSRESSGSPNKATNEIDFYEGMSLSELASFAVHGDDLDDGVEGHSSEDTEDMDPERQKYLENLIAQLQAGGGNIEFQQNEEGLYVCMFCSKTFIHKYPYRDHLKTHTGMTVNIL
jgi:hypothetical protein